MVTSFFWILCVGMAAFALVFVLPPLLSPQASPYASDGTADPRKRKALDQALEAGVIDRAEYARKLKALGNGAPAVRPNRAVPAVLALLLPLAAFGLYHQLGEPRALDPELRAPSPTSGARLVAPGASAAASSETASAGTAADAPAPTMDQAVAGLAERMRNSPDDLDGWMLLGRAYKTMERFEPAREAFANAFRLAPENADVMVEFAEAQTLASETKRIGGEPLMLIGRALAIEPDHQRGLWLLGISHMQAGVPSDAVTVWERLLPLVDEGARESLLNQIDSARASAGLPPRARETEAQSTASAVVPTPVAPAAEAASASGDAGDAARLIVNVELDPALQSRVGASDVLFVYARAAEGPRMPLAIQRLSAGDLPVRVVLDDSTSMMPTLKLSLMPQVVVGARISKSGQATPQPGDFEAVSEPISNRSREPLSLRIDRVIP